jgi:predicted DNA binding protein
MSVVLEFTIPADGFSLGRVLTGDTDVEIRLEAIVPTGDDVLPFFWVEGTDDDVDTFERRVRSRSMVKQLTCLDRLDDVALYRVTWETEPESLVSGLSEASGTMLSGRGSRDGWRFEVRFSDHADLTAFQNFLTDHDIRVHIERLVTLSGNERGSFSFDLTDEQREALVLAVSQGYFEVPRRIDLTDVAEELDITRQAASELVRRGANTVLRKALLEA